MRKIAVLYGGNSHQFRTLYEPKYHRYIHHIIYLPELQYTSLDDIDVLLIPSQLHKSLVSESQHIIDAFINRGGIVTALGAQPNPWLPGHNWEIRPTNFWWWLESSTRSGLVAERPDHDFFRYLTIKDATWHYHGVFFPPAGSDIIISVEDGGAIMYVDKVSTAGTFIMTTLDPEYHYGSYFMPATERFLDGFFPWLAEGKL
ncbi:hypothetical protein [Paenibacillus sp. IHBB 10380]|uniref:hypothetical protein n=1 Tax=Paenibacillus sp. IHBB 10380 TaxID=1566358 RepID=UPI0005CFABAF|nr:hypothetical protein [Paenibacillus sp. IHBB 10380]AJS59052.1 hypothetical protein UB51_11965 [Paenibacillus sp. IHBB 10380]